MKKNQQPRGKPTGLLIGKNFKISEKEFISRWHDCHPTHHTCVRWMMVLSKAEFNVGKQYTPHLK